jgi:hypothetical protein
MGSIIYVSAGENKSVEGTLHNNRVSVDTIVSSILSSTLPLVSYVPTMYCVSCCILERTGEGSFL